MSAPAVQFIAGQTGREWYSVNELLRDSANPFLDHLSDEQIESLGIDLRDAYTRAQNPVINDSSSSEANS